MNNLIMYYINYTINLIYKKSNNEKIEKKEKKEKIEKIDNINYIEDGLKKNNNKILYSDNV